MARGDAMVFWSIAFVIAGFIAIAWGFGGIAVVLLTIAGGLLFIYVLMLGWALMSAIGGGRRRKRVKPMAVDPVIRPSPSRAGSISGRRRSSRDSTTHLP